MFTIVLLLAIGGLAYFVLRQHLVIRRQHVLIDAARLHGKWRATAYFYGQVADIDERYPDTFIPLKRLLKQTGEVYGHTESVMASLYRSNAEVKRWVEEDVS